MTELILEHNRLNGVLFSILEFGAVAALAAFLAFSLARDGNTLGSLLVCGQVLNCLVVVSFGIGALRRGERGATMLRVFDSAHRAEVRRNHPHLTRHTMVLAASVLVPFVLAAAIAWDRTARGAS